MLKEEEGEKCVEESKFFKFIVPGMVQGHTKALLFVEEF